MIIELIIFWLGSIKKLKIEWNKLKTVQMNIFMKYSFILFVPGNTIQKNDLILVFSYFQKHTTPNFKNEPMSLK